MNKKFLSILIVISVFFISIEPVYASEGTLHAKYIAVIDADSERLLFDKDANIPAPNASTTKISTCITALEMCQNNIICTVSPYAASMPDVQLNAVKGDQFYIDDLYYSMMLKSHNDSAEIIAENVSLYYISCTSLDDMPFLDLLFKDYDYTENDLENLKSLSSPESFDSSILQTFSISDCKLLTACFECLVNYRFTVKGFDNINFVTPNGLDSDNLSGPHSISAYSLARIMSYCINNSDFLKITETKNYSFTNVSGSRSYSVSNANAFIDMYENIISGKTGFTGNAGYCYVCAYKDETRTFVVVLLACGWPGNKTYKWSDARQLLNQCRSSYHYEEIIGDNFYLKPIHIANGLSDSTDLYINETLNLLVSDNDKIEVVINVPSTIDAPCTKDEQVGNVNIFANETLIKSIPVFISSSISCKDFHYYIIKILTSYF